MLILHFADLHLDEYPGPVVAGVNSRLADIKRTYDYIVDYAIREEIDLVLFAGDAFKTKRPNFNVILMFAEGLRRLSEFNIPTICIPGNHDIPNDGLPGAFDIIKAMQIPNVEVVTRPHIKRVGGVQITCLPSFSKSTLLSKDEYKDLQAEEANKVMSQKIADIVTGLSAQLDPGCPSILIAHLTVVGCQLDNGEHVFLVQEPVLPLEALKASNFDLVCLGHIHRAQRLGHIGNVFYSGSPERLSFNEEGQPKGFYIHEVTEYEIASEFIETPARPFVTIDLGEKDVSAFIEDGHDLFGDVQDAIVRVRYEAPEELAKRFNHKFLIDRIYAQGAHWVQNITPEITKGTRARDEEVTEELTVLKALEKYLVKNEINNPHLVTLAESLIQKVGA